MSYQFQVYHATKPGFGLGPPPVWPDAYVKVADVECFSIDDAFQLTNTIEAPWWHNHGVTTSGRLGYRSTSVGDVIVRPDGQVFRVAPTGWEKVNETPDPAQK